MCSRSFSCEIKCQMKNIASNRRGPSVSLVASPVVHQVVDHPVDHVVHPVVHPVAHLAVHLVAGPLQPACPAPAAAKLPAAWSPIAFAPAPSDPSCRPQITPAAAPATAAHLSTMRATNAAAAGNVAALDPTISPEEVAGNAARSAFACREL